MQLSEIGKIVQTEWIKTPGIRLDMKLELLEFIVMPNHFHGIIVIGKNEYNRDTVGVAGKDDVINVGETQGIASLRWKHVMLKHNVPGFHIKIHFHFKPKIWHLLCVDSNRL